MARLAAALCATLLLIGAGPSAAGMGTSGGPTSATDFITGLADTSVRKLTEPNLREDERAERFSKLLKESFAVHGIARFVMGRYWRRATQEQRQEFIDLLIDTVTHAWANRFSEFSRGGLMVIDETPVTSSRPDETDAIVRTSYGTSDGGSLVISWRVANKGKVYKITDIQVEGISMVQTYRDEITAAVRRSGTVEGLLEEMRRNLARHDTSTI